MPLCGIRSLLYNLNVDGSGALCPFRDFKFELGALFDALDFGVGDVEENVFPTVFGLDETVALSIMVELYCSSQLSHLPCVF